MNLSFCICDIGGQIIYDGTIKIKDPAEKDQSIEIFDPETNQTIIKNVSDVEGLSLDRGGCGFQYQPWDYLFKTVKLTPFSNLLDLNLEHNPISDLEGLPTSLKSLHIGHTNVCNFDNINLPNLQSLDIRFNNIETLSGCPKSVIDLDVTATKIVSLVGAPSNCKKLVADFCPITTLEGCPKGLVKLHVNGTKIKDLAGAADTIKIIDCSNCDTLKTLQGCPSNLKQLKCQYSRNLESLEFLSKSVTGIDVIGSLGTFTLADFPNLEFVAVVKLPEINFKKPMFVNYLPREF